MAQTTRKLRVLIADGMPERLDEVTKTVTSLGHEVVGEGVSLDDRRSGDGRRAAGRRPRHRQRDRTRPWSLIRTIVHEAACPVIAILDVQDRAFIDQAARLGIFSYIAHGGDLEEMQSSIDVALQRFAEYHALEGAFGRRAVTERAKGILMERHGIDEQQAFAVLREHARRTSTKIVDVAASILASHRLLSSGATSPAPFDEEHLTRPGDER